MLLHGCSGLWSCLRAAHRLCAEVNLSMGSKGFSHRIRPTSISDVLEKSLRQAPEMTPCTHAVAWIGLHRRCTVGRNREASTVGS